MTASELFPTDTKIEIERAEETFAYGNHFYRRAATIDFVSQLAAAADSNPRGLHYYCDSLICPDTPSVTLKLPPAMTIHIFARDFLMTASTLSEIILERSALLTEQQVFIYFGDAPVNLLVKSAGSDKAVALIHDAQNCPSILMSSFQDGAAAMISHDHVRSALVSTNTAPLDDLLRQPTIDHDRIVQFVKAADSGIGGGPSLPQGPCPANMGVGRLIRLQKDQPVDVWVIEDVLSTELEPPLTADLVVLGQDLRRMVNLPILLQQLFSDVGRDILQNPAKNEISISRLRFIIRCTRSSSAYATLAANSQKLLDRLELPLRYGSKFPGDLRYYAPQLGFRDLHNNIKGALAICQSLEANIKRTDDELKLNEMWRVLYSTLLIEMGRNMSGFINSEDNLNKAKEAIIDCEFKRRDMEGYIDSTKKAMDRFNAGIDSLIARKRKELKNNIIATSMELLVSVGIAVATWGAGAPLTISNLGKAQKAITEGVELWDKIKAVVEKLLAVCVKMLPKLQAAWQNQARFNAKILLLNNESFQNPSGRKGEAGKALNESVGRISAGSLPADVMTRVDFLGMIADWDEFDVMTDAMFDDIGRELGQENIDGMTDYKVALKKQAIRGRLVVVTMRNAQEAVQFYHRQEAEKLARDARRKELETLGNRAEQDPRKLISQKILRWSMVQESATARQTLFVRCHQLFLALLYFANRPSLINGILKECSIGPESSAADFTKTLQALDNVYVENQVLEQMYTITVDTVYFPQFFPTDWREQLHRDQEFRFRIAHGKILALKNMARVRVLSMSVEFVDMKDMGNPANPLMWDWELGPTFTDVSEDGPTISYYMPTQVLRQINGDGKWGDQWKGNLPRPSVFCQEGRIVFVKPESSDSQAVDSDDLGQAPVDLSNVKQVKLTFTCNAYFQQ